MEEVTYHRNGPIKHLEALNGSIDVSKPYEIRQSTDIGLYNLKMLSQDSGSPYFFFTVSFC